MEIVCVNRTMQNQTGNKTKVGRERKKTKTCQNETHAPNQDFFAIKYEKFQCKQLVCFYHVYSKEIQNSFTNYYTSFFGCFKVQR